MSSSSPSTSAADIKSQIARLTATIMQHKSSTTIHTSTHYKRSNSYVNPNYKASNTYIRPATSIKPPPARPVQPQPTNVTETKEVVLGGVAFKSSSRSLVRKDLPKPQSVPKASTSQSSYSRKSGHLIANSRVYKPPSRGRRGAAMNRNMTLTNSRRPYQSQRATNKRLKYSDKPCPRFTMTGSCNRGLTCMYQHDPSKIAICWNFLQGNCPNTADSCPLSHDPTPERTPLCLHFLNKGRCNREKCPFPHVNVGARDGVCRDFAVLGFCEKGLSCDKQHVRECPDFAEKGTCSTKGCKLPHVIRANRNRKPISPPKQETSGSGDATNNLSNLDVSAEQAALPNGGQMGDEFISLTFNESESSDEEDEDDEESAESEEESTEDLDSGQGTWED